MVPDRLRNYFPPLSIHRTRRCNDRIPVWLPGGAVLDGGAAVAAGVDISRTCAIPSAGRHTLDEVILRFPSLTAGIVRRGADQRPGHENCS
jgi:hypothetical protein